MSAPVASTIQIVVHDRIESDESPERPIDLRAWRHDPAYRAGKATELIHDVDDLAEHNEPTELE